MLLAACSSAHPIQIKAHFDAAHSQVNAFSFSLAGREWAIRLASDHRVSVQSGGSTILAGPFRLSEPIDPGQIHLWADFSPGDQKLWDAAVEGKQSKGGLPWPEGEIHDGDPTWAWATISLPFVSMGFGSYPTLILAVHRTSGAWRISEIEELEDSDLVNTGDSLRIRFMSPAYDKQGAKIEVPAWIHFRFNGHNIEIHKSKAAR
jgi:hypothetical protein